MTLQTARPRVPQGAATDLVVGRAGKAVGRPKVHDCEVSRDFAPAAYLLTCTHLLPERNTVGHGRLGAYTKQLVPDSLCLGGSPPPKTSCPWLWLHPFAPSRCILLVCMSQPGAGCTTVPCRAMDAHASVEMRGIHATQRDVTHHALGSSHSRSLGAATCGACFKPHNCPGLWLVVC